MLASILFRYLILIVACVGLLLGIQLPNLADQYEKRVDAHLREVTQNFQPFQEIANKHFNGNIEKLIELHRKSEVKPFQEEGEAIEKMIKRKQRFEAEATALKSGLPNKIAHILFNSDKEMMDETLGQYSYAVPLNQDAIMVGVTVATAILLALELLLALARYATATVARKLSQRKAKPAQ